MTTLLSNRKYDVLKPITTTVLPGLGTLYFALAQLWDLPKAEEVIGTIAALNVFFGLILNVSSKQYHVGEHKYDGDLNVEIQENGQARLFLELNPESANLDRKSEATFKIKTK